MRQNETEIGDQNCGRLLNLRSHSTQAYEMRPAHGSCIRCQRMPKVSQGIIEVGKPNPATHKNVRSKSDHVRSTQLEISVFRVGNAGDNVQQTFSLWKTIGGRDQ